MPLVTPRTPGSGRPDPDLAERGQNLDYFRRKGSKMGRKRVILADFGFWPKTGVRVLTGSQYKVNAIAVWQRGRNTFTERPVLSLFWPLLTTFGHFSGSRVEFQLKHFSKRGQFCVKYQLTAVRTRKALPQNR